MNKNSTNVAKNVFALHGINAAGKAVLVKPNVPSDQQYQLGLYDLHS